MATHSSTLAWKIPRTEEPGRRQSMGSQGVGHNWRTSLSLSATSNRRDNSLTLKKKKSCYKFKKFYVPDDWKTWNATKSQWLQQSPGWTRDFHREGETWERRIDSTSCKWKGFGRQIKAGVGKGCLEDKEWITLAYGGWFFSKRKEIPCGRGRWGSLYGRPRMLN